MSRLSSLTPCRSASPRPPVVQPDHFYGADTPNAPPSPHSDSKAWVTPDDDPLAHRGIPVFRPTMAEFEDFEEYMKAVECWGMRSGIVKVIPPKEWTQALPSVIPQLRDVAIGSPIEQHMLGRGGLFRQENLEKRKFMSVREWVELCNKDDFRAPGVRDVGLGSRSANVRAPVVRSRKGKKMDGTKKAESAGPGVVNIKQEAADDSHQLAEASPAESSAITPPSSVVEAKSQIRRNETSAPSQEKPRTRSRRGPTKEQKEANHARDLAFIDNFDPHKDWLPPETKASDYTPEFCQKLERTYWRNLGLGKPAWYGADTQGSLFTDDTKSWNVAHLPSTLSRILPSSANGLPGVNTPYLYFGMWRATFSWHVEDMDLFSINYIHFGAPKFWYAIPQGRACALEQTMQGYFPKDTSQCPQFLRHKSFLASPNILAQSSCRPNFLVQHAGEFVITYPRGYHAGLNLGLNCAESVNFALDSWVEIGRKAKACNCISDSVRIDVDQLLRDRADEGQELPTFPAPVSKSKKSGVKSRSAVKKEELDSDLITDLPRTSRKRQADGGEDSTKLKKIKIKPSPHKASASASTSFKPPFPKISITLKLPPRPMEPDAFPCCLCISMDREGLLKVHEPPVGRKEAVEAAGNPEIWMAHELCAKVVPETWVDETEQNNVKQKMVFGVDGIVRDRWNLKCSACTKSRPKAHGAPVQCTKGKCPKAFHISCARESAALVFDILREVEKEVVLLEPSTVSNMQVDSTEAAPVQEMPRNDQVLKVIQKYDVQLLCSQHNPAVAAEKKASKQEKIKQDLLALPSMSRIKIRVSAGVFEVSLVRVIEEAGTVEVLWDRGLKKEFKWGSVVFGSTDGPVFSKPSEPAPESQVPQSIPSGSYLSLPLRTPSLPTPSSTTLAPTSIPATVSQPSTSYSVPYYPSSRPGYNYWPYSNNGGTPYTQYPYPYGSYYASVPGNTNSQYTPYLYAQNQYRGGQLQWQQPYQGPRLSSTATDQEQSSHPTSDQIQLTDTAPAQTGSVPNAVSQEDNAEATAKTSSTTPTHSSPPIDVPPSEGSGDSQQAFTLTLEMEQAILTNLQALSVMQPAQLAELLQSNPQLQTVLAVMNQARPSAPEAS